MQHPLPTVMIKDMSTRAADSRSRRDAVRLAEGINLEQWRLSHSLTYEALARTLGLFDGALARKYATGSLWPNAERLDHILAATGGQVSVLAMHKVRLAWCRTNGAHRPHVLQLPVTTHPRDAEEPSPPPDTLAPPPEPSLILPESD